MIMLNKIATEPYKGSGKIEASVSSGFASIKQKSTLVGLKVIVDSKILFGDEAMDIKRGQIVYIQEELLHAQGSGWSKKTYDADGIEEKFIIVDPTFVVLIK